MLLSSGVWNEKHINTFQKADMHILSRVYDENNENDTKQLFEYLNHAEPIESLSGELRVEDGKVLNEISILHARSIAEDVVVFKNNVPFSGKIDAASMRSGITVCVQACSDSTPSMHMRGVPAPVIFAPQRLR